MKLKIGKVIEKKVIRLPTVKELINAGAFKDIEKLFWSYEPPIKHRRKKKKQSKILWLLLLLFFLIKQGIWGGLLTPIIRWLGNWFWPLIVGFGTLLIKKIHSWGKKIFPKLKRRRPFNKFPRFQRIKISQKLQILPPLALASVPVLNYHCPFLPDIKPVIKPPDLLPPPIRPIDKIINWGKAPDEKFLPSQFAWDTPFTGLETSIWRKALEDKKKDFLEGVKEDLGLEIDEGQLKKKFGGNTDALKAIGLKDAQKKINADIDGVLRDVNFDSSLNKNLNWAEENIKAARARREAGNEEGAREYQENAEAAIREANYTLASAFTELRSKWGERLAENKFVQTAEESVTKIAERGDCLMKKVENDSQKLVTTLFGAEVLNQEEKDFLALYFPLKFEEAKRIITEAKWKELWGIVESFSLTKLPESPLQGLFFAIGLALTAVSVAKIGTQLAGAATKMAATLSNAARGVAQNVLVGLANTVGKVAVGRVAVVGGGQFFTIHGAHLAKATARFASMKSIVTAAKASVAKTAAKVAARRAAKEAAKRTARAAAFEAGWSRAEQAIKVAKAAGESLSNAVKNLSSVTKESVKGLVSTAKEAQRAAKEAFAAAKAANSAGASISGAAAKAVGEATAASARAVIETAKEVLKREAKQSFFGKVGGIVGRVGTFLKRTPAGLKTLSSKVLNGLKNRKLLAALGGSAAMTTMASLGMQAAMSLKKDKNGKIDQKEIPGIDDEEPSEKILDAVKGALPSYSMAFFFLAATALPIYIRNWRRNRSYRRRH